MFIQVSFFVIKKFTVLYKKANSPFVASLRDLDPYGHAQ